MRLELTGAGGSLRGSVAIDLPAEPGSGCPPLRKRYAIAETIQGPGTLSFTDSGGNEWTLVGAAERQRAAGAPRLAPGRAGAAARRGFHRPGREAPHDAAERRGAAAPGRRGGRGGGGRRESGPGRRGAGGRRRTPPAGAGKYLGHVGAIIGANVVGLGLLYGANKLGKGSSESGVLTCSPRTCIVGATINDPCFCEGNVVSGAPCGTTTGGAPINAPCDGKSVPCQSTLSCNSGVCQDRDGRCPY